MPNLYLIEQGAVLGKTGDRLVILKDGQKLLDVRCAEVQAVMVFGNVQVSTQALHKLMEQGTELAFLTRRGKLICQLTSPFTKNIELRIEQFKRFQDEPFKVELSRRVVAGKLSNGRRLLAGFVHNHPEVELKEIIGAIEAAERSVENADSLESLRGIEGSAARAYFAGFAKMILSDFIFEGRKKRPSPDPVNALLSLGYTMFFNEIQSLLDGLGFDPFLGYFHNPEYGRPSLAADILEEFRPTVDRFTLALINNNALSPWDFFKNPKDGGCYLKDDALKKYFAQYEEQMNREFRDAESGETTTLRKRFRAQAEKLRSYIKGGAEYEPFRLEA